MCSTKCPVKLCNPAKGLRSNRCAYSTRCVSVSGTDITATAPKKLLSTRCENSYVFISYGKAAQLTLSRKVVWV